MILNLVYTQGVGRKPPTNNQLVTKHIDREEETHNGGKNDGVRPSNY